MLPLADFLSPKFGTQSCNDDSRTSIDIQTGRVKRQVVMLWVVDVEGEMLLVKDVAFLIHSLHDLTCFFERNGHAIDDGLYPKFFGGH